MISKREKYWIHRYKRWAGLSDPDYRSILRAHTGMVSCADRRFSNHDTDRVMAALETILWSRIDDRKVQNPGGISRTYWRDKVPADGMLNSRLKWKLCNLFGLLCDYIPKEEQNDAYLAAVMAHACGTTAAAFLTGTTIAWHRVSAECARLTIEALKDRLRYAVVA